MSSGLWSNDRNLSNEDEETEELSAAENSLFVAVEGNDAAAVQQAIQDAGANVNCVRIFDDGYNNSTPLLEACLSGSDEIVRILLDAGADARWKNIGVGCSAVSDACAGGHLLIVELLLNHDNDLLEIADNDGWTPLFYAVYNRHSEMVRFLLDRGANARATDADGLTTLMLACQQRGGDLDIVRLLLNADVDNLGARDRNQKTALHYAARPNRIEVVRELILQHNANMFAADKYGMTPFDLLHDFRPAIFLIEIYGNKLTHDHGRLALHAILGAAEYSLEEDNEFHPPLKPLRIRLPLGKLTLQHFRTLLHGLDTELVRNRDESGKLPIHIACRNNAPVEFLSMLVETDPATLQIADYSGALPIHSLCCSVTAEYACVRYLVEQGGVGTLAARKHQGALPLHALCGSTNPPLRAVQYLLQSFPGSVAARTSDGQYPFMIAACQASATSLSVVYELVRANPNLVVLR